jgi:hypothetical protein
MAHITREDVTSVLGQVDDSVVAQIVGLGATRQELIEAHAWLSNDEALMNDGRPLPSSRVGQVIAVLERLDEEAPVDPRP